MSNQTPNLSMPYILPAQAQKHVTHNEAIEVLDAVVQLALESAGDSAPPANPQEGQAWAIAANATGDWAGQDGLIGTWRGGGWLFISPQDGWIAWVRDVSEIQVYTSGAWTPQGEQNMQNLPAVGVNTTADSTNRLSVSSPATLLNNEGAGHQLKINKATAGDTASLLFQSGFSGRAEMGLAGTDDFSIKVSDDGTNFVTALGISAAGGTVQIGNLLNLNPGSAPAAPSAGDVYFDSSSSKLRCYDGTAWNDLF